MRIICAPDSFKESLSASEVARAMAEGLRGRDREIRVDHCPVADGGEGTLQVLIEAAGGEVRSEVVSDPRGRLIPARFGLRPDGRTAIVELAEASGLQLVSEQDRDPTRTTTFGTGQLLEKVMRLGARQIIVGVGGSATVDGGTGLAQAFGVGFFDAEDRPLPRPLTGGDLPRIARIEPLTGPFPEIRVACDVDNPLCGARGAAIVYGPQKGATPEQVEQLDAGLAHLARLTGHDPNSKAFGAAGGAAFGLHAFLGARLERGTELVLETIGFDDRCRGADLVLTGEGRLDAQSLHGKAALGVAAAAARLGVPTVAIVGDTGPGAERCLKEGRLQRYVSLAQRYGRERALQDTAELIREVVAEVVREYG